MMKKRLLFFVCVLLSPSLLTFGQTSLAIDELIAGLKHAESLLHSGIAEDVEYTPGDRPTQKSTFAFKGKSRFCHRGWRIINAFFTMVGFKSPSLMAVMV